MDLKIERKYYMEIVTASDAASDDNAVDGNTQTKCLFKRQIIIYLYFFQYSKILCT